MLFTQRNIEIFRAVLKGESYAKVGERYSISRQRVEQLFKSMAKRLAKADSFLEPFSEIPVNVFRQQKDFYLAEINKIYPSDVELTHVSINY